jgi:hypothetical protein
VRFRKTEHSHQNLIFNKNLRPKSFLSQCHHFATDIRYGEDPPNHGKSFAIAARPHNRGNTAMNTFSMILSALLVLALLVVIAPGVLAMNRGKTLRNMALWLAIALGLALVYQTFGPGKNQSLTTPSAASPTGEADPDSDSHGTDELGYTPPREE